MTRKIRPTATHGAEHGTLARGTAQTSVGAAPPSRAEGSRTKVNGDERHDANAHRTKGNATNHFGADGEDQYGGGARVPRKSRTAKEAS